MPVSWVFDLNKLVCRRRLYAAFFRVLLRSRFGTKMRFRIVAA